MQDAGQGQVLAGTVYDTESRKQDSKRFNFIMKTIHFAHLGILFIYDVAIPLDQQKLAKEIYLLLDELDLCLPLRSNNSFLGVLVYRIVDTV